MVDKRADAAAAYAKAPKPSQTDEPSGDEPDAEQAATPGGDESPGAAAGPGADQAQAESRDEAVAVETQDVQQGDSATDGGDLVEQDLDELTHKANKADEYLVLAQRTQADFENYRKRAARDASLAQERGVAKLAKELLPAIDSLERAVQATAEEESQIADGVKLVQADLLAALARVGIEPFSPEGEPFDPQWHEAVAQNQVEGVDPGIVIDVYQQGYRLGETVLRPARVLVAA